MGEKRQNRLMKPMNPYFFVLIVGVSFGLSTPPVQAASVEPGPQLIDRLIEAARVAGFSTPEIKSSTVVGASQGVPALPPPPATQVDGGKSQANDDFQEMLFNLALEPVDQAFCDGKLGAMNKKNAAAYRACRITRNFLWYIQAKPEGVNGRFPPLADIRYCRTEAEIDEVISRLEAALK